MDLNKIGNFIVYLRKEKKLTQFQLAEELGVSDKTISKWERGICLPESATVEKIIKFFNISLMEFYAGERNKRLTDEIANETTKSAVELSKKTEKIKCKKIISLVILSGVIIVFIISMLFMYSTYNKYHVYSISSSKEEYVGKGNIIFANEKSIITLIDLSIIDNNIFNKKGYSFEYTLLLNDLLLCHSGDIYTFEKNSASSKISIGDYVRDLSIYMNYDLSEFTSQDTLEKENLSLVINYINENLEVEEYIMEFKISKSFSNNKILMSKIVY